MKQFLIASFLFMLIGNAMYSKESFNLSNKADAGEFKQKSLENDTLYFFKRNNFKPILFSDCIENISLINVETNLSYLYWAANSIVVSDDYQVNPNFNITMKAGKVIILKPSTKILKGSKYLARIEACENECANLEIPKGISPNGDGFNDTFDLSDFCKIKNCKIFNRYGVAVFEKDEYTNQWNGLDNNDHELPDATYYYVLRFEKGDVRTGWVYINR
ncbi:gliding motility-associated C-terminal domain-containing protein [Flavobacterium sp.]|uniref:gliding motility-associated C-terminal domain-containing protein n=1 Tax=Flavobacterium sp. TaxID=239 RepID=UPI00262EA68A|nr:gliding motility-associated C-terminal domain-containing protein [Flavobacterium sp.]